MYWHKLTRPTFEEEKIFHPKKKFMNITLSQAEAAIKAAKEKSKKLGTLMNIAVVDAGTNLIAFVHEDGAWLGSIDISQRKARTARYFNMDSCLLYTSPSPRDS